MKSTIALFTLLLTSPALAHEGHDVPGSVQAHHGGIIKPTKQMYLELVQEGKTVKLFPISHELKPIPLKEVKMTATAQLPKGKKKEPVALTENNSQDPAKSHFSGSFDAKGAHRYSLEISLEHEGKKEKVVFQVEPRS